MGLTFADSAHLNKVQFYTAFFAADSFKKIADFGESEFTEQADFTNCVFQQRAVFGYVKFDGLTSYVNAVFNGGLSFFNSNFKSGANLSDAEFNGPIDLYQAEFIGNAYFPHAKFLKQSDFISSAFTGDADFDSATFLHNVRFGGTRFSKSVNFQNASFLAEANFASVRFGSSAFFRNLKLSDTTKFFFQDADLPDTLDFSHFKSTNEIDLSRANSRSSRRLSHPTLLYLYKFDITKLNFDYRYFKLLFADPAIGYPTPLTDEERETIYEGLLKNFGDRGQRESYEKLDKEYQAFKHPYIGWFLRIWWDYGYKKQLVFLWVLGFLFLFTCLTRWKLFTLLEVYSMTDIVTGLVKYPQRIWWYSFVYTAVIFFSLTLKVEKMHFANRRGAFFIMLVYTIGIVCLAYMANFVLQK